MCEGCNRAIKTLPFLATFCLCMHTVRVSDLLYLCVTSLFHRHGLWGESYKEVVIPSREIRDAFDLSLRSGNFHIYSLHHWLLYQHTNSYVRQHSGNNMVCQYLIRWLTQSPVSFTFIHTYTHIHTLAPKKDTICTLATCSKFVWVVLTFFHLSICTIYTPLLN